MTGPLRLGLLGRGIAHSLSPMLHQTALTLAGLDGDYRLFDCDDESAARAVIQRLRTGELHGLNVTTPWKPLALSSAQAWQRTATHRAGVLTCPANTLRMDGPRLVATSTDGHGLTAALLVAGMDLTHKSVLLLGAGGAGQAIAADLLAMGISQLLVTNRTSSASAALSERLAAIWPGRVRSHTWGQTRGLATVDVVIHATRVGHGRSATEQEVRLITPEFAWLPWSSWARRPPLLCDLGYAAELTPWQALAHQHGQPVDARLSSPLIEEPRIHAEPRAPVGILAFSGQAMLAYQAARAFQVWTGCRVDGATLLRAILPPRVVP